MPETSAAPPPASSDPGARQALSDATDRTHGGPAFRLTIHTVGTASSGAATLDGVGLVETPQRYTLKLTIRRGSQQLVTEALGYDGRTWTRTDEGTWQSGDGTTALQDTSSFATYARTATGVQDDGPMIHAMVPCEQFSGQISAAPGSSPGQLKAWVSRSSGYLVGEEVTASDLIGGVNGTVSIELSDYGTTDRVPASPLP